MFRIPGSVLLLSGTVSFFFNPTHTFSNQLKIVFISVVPTWLRFYLEREETGEKRTGGDLRRAAPSHVFLASSSILSPPSTGRGFVFFLRDKDGERDERGVKAKVTSPASGGSSVISGERHQGVVS